MPLPPKGIKLNDLEDGVLLRRLRPEDKDEISRLLEEIGAELAHRRGGRQLLGELGDLRNIAAMVCQPRSDLFGLGGIVGDVFSGVIWARIVMNAFDDAICILPVFSVLKAFRGNSIGRKLYDQAESWARSKGVSAIEVIALPGDRETKIFCESRGLVARSLTMHKSLS